MKNRKFFKVLGRKPADTKCDYAYASQNTEKGKEILHNETNIL